MMHSHIGELAALLVAIFWTASALAFESASKAVGSLAVNIIRLVIALLFLCSLTWITRGLPLPTDATAYQWFWLSLSGFVGFVLGDLFLFKSFTVIGSRFAMLIMNLAPPIAATCGWIFLGEQLTIYSMIGIILTVSGISMAVVGRHPQHEKLRLNMPVKGFLYAFGGAVGQALGLLLSKKGMAGYDAFAATEIRIITGIIGFSVLIVAMRRVTQLRIAFTNGRAMIQTTIGSFFGPFLGVSLSLLSLKYTATGIAAAIMATTPIIIIIPSVLFYKQKVTVKEMIGAIVSFIGVAMFFIR